MKRTNLILCCFSLFILVGCESLNRLEIYQVNALTESKTITIKNNFRSDLKEFTLPFNWIINRSFYYLDIDPSIKGDKKSDIVFEINGNGNALSDNYEVFSQNNIFQQHYTGYAIEGNIKIIFSDNSAYLCKFTGYEPASMYLLGRFPTIQDAPWQLAFYGEKSFFDVWTDLMISIYGLEFLVPALKDGYGKNSLEFDNGRIISKIDSSLVSYKSKAIQPLIDLLADVENKNKEHTAELLKRITSQDFGLSSENWQQWWDKNKFD